MSVSAREEMLSRLQALTPREQRVLLLLVVVDASTGPQDIADVLGTSTSVVAGARQAIRRELALPPGADLADVLAQRGIADLSGVLELAQPVTTDRRRDHVLRAAIRELDNAVKRILTKASALLHLATYAPEHEREVILNEVAVVRTLSERIGAVRDEAIATARSSGH